MNCTEVFSNCIYHKTAAKALALLWPWAPRWAIYKHDPDWPEVTFATSTDWACKIRWGVLASIVFLASRVSSSVRPPLTTPSELDPSPTSVLFYHSSPLHFLYGVYPKLTFCPSLIYFLFYFLLHGWNMYCLRAEALPVLSVGQTLVPGTVSGPE